MLLQIVPGCRTRPKYVRPHEPRDSQIQVLTHNVVFNKIDILQERSPERLSQHPASVDKQDDDELMLVVKSTRFR